MEGMKRTVYPATVYVCNFNKYFYNYDNFLVFYLYMDIQKIK